MRALCFWKKNIKSAKKDIDCIVCFLFWTFFAKNTLINALIYIDFNDRNNKRIKIDDTNKVKARLLLLW